MTVLAEKLSKSPADLLAYRKDLVRTHKFLPLGRMRTIAIGPCASYTPPAGDPIINGWGDQPQRNARGRMIDLSGQWLSIGQDTETGMILVTASLRNKDGYVALPDLADPRWVAPRYTAEEAMNPDCSVGCTLKVDIGPDGKPKPHVHVNSRAGKDTPRMIPQRLEDRTNDRLGGTNYLVFQPVERITYQPEEMKAGEHQFKPAEWRIRFQPDNDGVFCAFLCDTNTGECHFFGGTAIFEGDARG